MSLLIFMLLYVVMGISKTLFVVLSFVVFVAFVAFIKKQRFNKIFVSDVFQKKKKSIFQKSSDPFPTFSDPC